MLSSYTINWAYSVIFLLLPLLLPAVMEKYWEARRELETLRQRLKTEHEDEVERLEADKQRLEKKVSYL